MRTVITGGSILMIAALFILTQASIVSTNLRDNEVNCGLNAAADYAMDILADIYEHQSDIPERGTEYLKELMTGYCEALNQVIGTDGVVSVYLMNADLKTGMFDISIREEYTYPFKNKTGVCFCEKAFILK